MYSKSKCEMLVNMNFDELFVCMHFTDIESYSYELQWTKQFVSGKFL